MKTLLYKAIALYWLVCIAFETIAQQNYSACGVQTGTWQYDTVFVDCDIAVPQGTELQIMPGTKVIFRGHYAIDVQGTLKAIGTSADSIIFAVIDTTGFSNIHTAAGGWAGLRFHYTLITNDSSLFSYCSFKYGKAVGDSVNCYGGAVAARQTDKIAFRHCTFSHNYAFYWGGAAYSYKANLIFEHCRFLHNRAGNDEGLVYGYGGAISCVSSEPDILGCHFEFNSSTGIGGAVSFEYSRPLLMNSVFEHNFSALGGAIGFLRTTAERPIANLLIRANEAIFFGGGIANITASPLMTNLTIVNNFAPMGGGYYCNFEAHARLYNSILWGNTCAGDFGSQVWIWDVNSVPEFHHSAVQYGVQGFGGSMFIGVYNNCIEADPMFIDQQGANFGLLAGSPCINAGTENLPGYNLPEIDLNGDPRMVGQAPDMGAYEYQGTVGLIKRSAHAAEYRLLHHGTLGRVLVWDVGAEAPTAVRLFSSDGRMLASFENPENSGQLMRLEHILNQANFSAGVYLLELKLPGGRSRGLKMLH